jgi:F0F1-type ATP synthase assembly protein I
MQDENNLEKPKHQDKIVALDSLSLGISIVAAIIIGFGIGYGLKYLTGYTWTLWLGIFWGILAAGMNVYKAYKRAQKVYEGMENDPRYAYRAKHGDKSFDKDDDED